MNLRLCWESLGDEPGDAEQHRHFGFPPAYFEDNTIANLPIRFYMFPISEYALVPIIDMRI